MNTHFTLSILIFIGFITVTVGCSSSGGTVNQDQKENQNYEETWTLRDHLQRATGVRITGSEGSTRIIIRGESSIVNPGNQPLFIIDGQKAGRIFSRVNDLLREGEINYIEVLPPSKASQYGMEGNFGVIRVFTEDSKS